MSDYINPLLLNKIKSMDIPEKDRRTMLKILNIEFEMGDNSKITDNKIKKIKEELTRGASDEYN